MLGEQAVPMAQPDGACAPDEIGALRFRLPEARSGASDMRIELLAATREFLPNKGLLDSLVAGRGLLGRDQEWSFGID